MPFPDPQVSWQGHYLAPLFPRLYPAVLRDLREEFHGSEQCPAVRALGRGEHSAVRPGAPQEGKRVLPQQLLWRRLPFPGTAGALPMEG